MQNAGDMYSAQPHADQKKKWWSTRSAHVVGVVIALAAIGGGSFAIASAVTSTNPVTTSSFATPGAHNAPRTPHAPNTPFGSRPGGGAAQDNGGAPTAIGSVQSISSSSFALLLRSGKTDTVQVSSATKYVGQGNAVATFSALKVGDRVGVIGALHGSVINATRVLLSLAPGRFGARRGGFGFGGNGTYGTVISVGASSFVITTNVNTRETVDVSSSTTFRGLSTGSASLSTLKAGDAVIAIGPVKNGTITASSVFMLFPGAGRFGGGFGGGGFGGPPSTTSPAA